MSHHLLIVDDDEHVLTVLYELFSSRGYQVTRATDGKQALDLSPSTNLDLILADYQMPHMNGIELLKQAQTIFPNAVRILLTGHGDLNLAMAAINEANVYKFITKPWNNSDLLLTVQRALEHQDLIRQQCAFAETLELMVEEDTLEIERLRQALRDMAAKIRRLVP